MNHKLFKAKSLANAKKNGVSMLDVKGEAVRELTELLALSDEGENDLGTLRQNKFVIWDIFKELGVVPLPDSVELMYAKCFVHYLSEIEVTELDSAVLAEMMDYTLDSPFDEFFIVYDHMNDKEEGYFFRAVAEKPLLRKTVAKCIIELLRRLELTDPAFWRTYNGRRLYKFLWKAISYFPECIEALVQYVAYSYESPWQTDPTAMVKLLQMVVDLKYLLDDSGVKPDEYNWLCAFVEVEAEQLVIETMSPEVIWMLKEHFGLESDRVYNLFDLLYEWEEFDEDDIKEWLMVPEGLEFVQNNRFRLVSEFPCLIYDIAMVSSSKEKRLLLDIGEANV